MTYDRCRCRSRHPSLGHKAMSSLQAPVADLRQLVHISGSQILVSLPAFLPSPASICFPARHGLVPSPRSSQADAYSIGDIDTHLLWDLCVSTLPVVSCPGFIWSSLDPVFDRMDTRAAVFFGSPRVSRWAESYARMGYTCFSRPPQGALSVGALVPSPVYIPQGYLSSFLTHTNWTTWANLPLVVLGSPSRSSPRLPYRSCVNHLPAMERILQLRGTLHTFILDPFQ
ncbi:hypothetical protein DFH06DRAFT_1467537 [Mycena polygramma]|nr:hypothetical protein DFH06DRAFT_1467537 [Mycena polygramma]